MNRKLILFVALLACLVLPVGLVAAQDDTAAGADSGARLLYNGLFAGAGEPGADWQEIATMNADGTGQTRLTLNDVYDGEAAWSPDGGRIAFLHGDLYDRQIFIMNADGSGSMPLTDYSEGDSPSRPTWSPDGMKLAFAKDGLLHVINRDGTGDVTLVVDAGSVGAPSWSPDGQLIAFAVYNSLSATSDIYVINPDGTGLNNLTRSVAVEDSPDWSPDGARLVFSRHSGDFWRDLYTISRNGGNLTRLTKTGRTEDYPSWSPDGRRIAFVRWLPNSQGQLVGHIFTMSANGRNPKQITSGLGEYYPDWQPPVVAPHATFLPTNDAYVNSAQKNAILNKPRLLVKDAAADMNTYLKFNVAGLAGTVQSATLRLWVVDAGPDGGRVYATSPYYAGTTTFWLETGLNWNNAPAISGAPLATIGAVAVGRWVEVDVTAAVLAADNGRVSLAITNDSANAVGYSSKEGAHAPELVIVTD